MDFRDGRGMNVVLVPHCALNQNARLEACAESPAAVTALVEGLMARGIGILQMPCPELMVLGLDRGHTEIRSGIESRPVRETFRRMAQDLAYQVAEYRKCGVRVLGVLGKNGSPSCGVETTHRRGAEAPGLGVFLEELKAELGRQGLRIQAAGILDAAPDAALATVDRWLCAGRRGRGSHSRSGASRR
jgi:predicted secreted protein